MDSVVLFRNVPDEDDDRDCPSFEFIINTNTGLTCKALYSQENIPVHKWEFLLVAMRSNKKESIVFMNSNGCISIDTCDGNVIFGLSSYGGDNCCEMKISIPNSACLNAFEEAHQTLCEYFHRNGKQY